MTCKKCIEKPVINLKNNSTLCKQCFLKYFQRKALKTIKKFKMLDKEDKIAVALSGGKDSLSVIYILSLIAERNPKIKLEAILIDEGIEGYREHTIKPAEDLCKKLGIRLNIYSYEKEFGKSLDGIMEKSKDTPCSICGVLRRKLLNKKARELGCKKLATGHNMDDEAQSIMMNILKNNMSASSRIGPITGVRDEEKFIKRIKPFYLLSEKEVAVYAFLKGFNYKFTECPNSRNSFRDRVRDMINNIEDKYPGSKGGIIKSFLEMSPLIKKEYKKVDIRYCSKCGEPCSRDICKSCEVLIKNELL